MSTKKTANIPVTEEYLDKKLDDKAEEISKRTTASLDKRTEEIIDTVKSLFETQNEKIDTILDVVTGTKKDIISHSIRLNDHDSRIEKLEAKIN